jgi:hypothetical protein
VNVTLQRAGVKTADGVTSPSSHASRSRWPLNRRYVLRFTSNLSAEAEAVHARLVGVRHGLALRQSEVRSRGEKRSRRSPGEG